MAPEIIVSETGYNEQCDVFNGKSSWKEVCFVQFLCVRATEVHRIPKAAPQIPLLASAGAQHPVP